MSKHARIIALKQEGHATAAIAAAVGVSKEYVRACWLRHTNPEKHVIPHNVKKVKRYRNDPIMREQRRKYYRDRWRNNPSVREAANASARRRYAESKQPHA